MYCINLNASSSKIPVSLGLFYGPLFEIMSATVQTIPLYDEKVCIYHELKARWLVYLNPHFAGITEP
jgi:hypothetical protein